MGKKTCTDYEKQLFFLLLISISGFDGQSSPGKGWMGALVRAFGFYDSKFVKRTFGDFVMKRDFVVKKLDHVLKGKSFFNSVTLQMKTFSPLMNFKKKYVRDFWDCYERVPDNELKQK